MSQEAIAAIREALYLVNGYVAKGTANAVRPPLLDALRSLGVPDEEVYDKWRPRGAHSNPEDGITYQGGNP